MKSNQFRIVYTILGTFNSGGMERVLANKVNYLAKMGYEIVIVTTDQKSRSSYFQINSTVRQIDLAINYTDDIKKGIFRRLVSFLKKNKLHRKRLKEVLYEVRPDITISMFDNDASFITRIKDGSKKILEIHFSRFKRLQYGRTGIWKLIDKVQSKRDLSIVKKFDLFVVLTKEDQKYWGNLENIRIIPNANSYISQKVSDLKQKQVLAIGRLDYQKGFDNLIKIWYKIYDKYPDWKLNIYGNGPLKENLNELITSLSISHSVKICTPTKNIEDVYLKHSILAMTSRYEGLPMVLLEGQVFGLPLISYACKCGPSDIIENGYNGFLIPERDMEQFSSQLEKLMQSQVLRTKMGENSHANAKNYTEKRIMDQWIMLFNELKNP